MFLSKAAFKEYGRSLKWCSSDYGGQRDCGGGLLAKGLWGEGMLDAVRMAAIREAGVAWDAGGCAAPSASRLRPRQRKMASTGIHQLLEMITVQVDNINKLLIFSV